MTRKKKHAQEVSADELREMSPDERAEYVTWVTKDESDAILDEVEEAVGVEPDDDA